MSHFSPTSWTHVRIHELMRIAFNWLKHHGYVDEKDELINYEAAELFAEFRLAKAFRKRMGK